MSLDLCCPHCNKPQSFLESAWGREVKCSDCRRRFVATYPPRIMKRSEEEDAWDSVRPRHKPAAASEAPIRILGEPDESDEPASSEEPISLTARFSIAISPPPHEKGDYQDESPSRARQRRGLVYLPDRVNLEKMREREAAGDYSGMLVLGAAGVATLTTCLLVVLVFLAAFSQPPRRDLGPFAGRQSVPRLNQNPAFGQQPLGNLSRQNGLASFGFDGAPQRPWFEKTLAEQVWQAQNKNLKVVYLADLAEVVTAAPDQRFGKNGQVGNRANNVIQVQGRAAPKGLGLCGPAHSYCAVQYVLPPGARHFKAWVAINDSSNGPANQETFQFAVLLDGKTVAVSRVLSVRGECDSCTVNVSGAKVLELRGYTLKGRAFQHPVWLEPRLYVQP